VDSSCITPESWQMIEQPQDRQVVDFVDEQVIGERQGIES
jgi:hypothetical protein